MTEIHHLAGHDQLFDDDLRHTRTTPSTPAALLAAHDLTVTDHQPGVQPLPDIGDGPAGVELGLRVEYDTHKFGAAEIATVVARFERCWRR